MRDQSRFSARAAAPGRADLAARRRRRVRRRHTVRRPQSAAGDRGRAAARCGDGRPRHRLHLGERAHDALRSATGRFRQRAGGRRVGGRAPEGSRLRQRAHRDLPDHRLGARHARARSSSLPAAQPLVVAALGESPPTPAGGLEGDVVIFPTPRGAQGRARRLPDRQDRDGDAAHGAHAGRRRLRAGRGGARRRPERGRAARRDRVPDALGRHRQLIASPTPARRATSTARVRGARVCPEQPGCGSARAHRGHRADRARAPVLRAPPTCRTRTRRTSSRTSRARAKPEEVVLLGAHLDSWDQGTGAIDDGTGTAIITAAAKLIRDLPHRPQRTVRVVLFGSEEIAQPVKPFGDFGGHCLRHQPPGGACQPRARRRERLWGRPHLRARAAGGGHPRAISHRRSLRVLTPDRGARRAAPAGGCGRRCGTGGAGGRAGVRAQPGRHALLRHPPHPR